MGWWQVRINKMKLLIITQKVDMNGMITSVFSTID